MLSQSDCIFAIVDKAGTKLAKTFFLDLSLIYIGKRVWTPSGPRFGTHLGSQNRSQIDLEAVLMGIGFGASILRGGTPMGELWMHPETRALVPGYIYTRIS